MKWICLVVDAQFALTSASLSKQNARETGRISTVNGSYHKKRQKSTYSMDSTQYQQNCGKT
jgi:hypothetical protein